MILIYIFLLHFCPAPFFFAVGTGGQEISYKQKKLGSIELDVDMCPGTPGKKSWHLDKIMKHFGLNFTVKIGSPRYVIPNDHSSFSLSNIFFRVLDEKKLISQLPRVVFLVSLRRSRKT